MQVGTCTKNCNFWIWCALESLLGANRALGGSSRARGGTAAHCNLQEILHYLTKSNAHDPSFIGRSVCRSGARRQFPGARGCTKNCILKLQFAPNRLWNCKLQLAPNWPLGVQIGRSAALLHIAICYIILILIPVLLQVLILMRILYYTNASINTNTKTNAKLILIPILVLILILILLLILI